jgi:hypothetical protein
MKSYLDHQSLHLVGKAWEIRHYLRKLLATHQQETIVDYLSKGSISKMTPQSPSLTLISPLPEQ